MFVEAAAGCVMALPAVELAALALPVLSVHHRLDMHSLLAVYLSSLLQSKMCSCVSNVKLNIECYIPTSKRPLTLALIFLSKTEDHCSY